MRRLSDWQWEGVSDVDRKYVEAVEEWLVKKREKAVGVVRKELGLGARLDARARRLHMKRVRCMCRVVVKKYEGGSEYAAEGMVGMKRLANTFKKTVLTFVEGEPFVLRVLRMGVVRWTVRFNRCREVNAGGVCKRGWARVRKVVAGGCDGSRVDRG